MAKSSAHTPTPDERNYALATVWYEIAEFARDLAMLAFGQYPQEMKNPLIEAMLIHVRALLDFFQNSRLRRKKWRQVLVEQGARGLLRWMSSRGKESWRDVLSEDFGFPCGKVRLPKETRDRINREVAHISYSRFQRIEQDNKDWYFKPLLPLVDRCIQFVDSLSDPQKGECAQFLASKSLPRQWDDLRNCLVKLQTGLTMLPDAPQRPRTTSQRAASSAATGSSSSSAPRPST